MVRDMTAGSPSKILVTFALPMILGNVFQQLYNIVDSVVVGNFVGSDALAGGRGLLSGHLPVHRGRHRRLDRLLGGDLTVLRRQADHRDEIVCLYRAHLDDDAERPAFARRLLLARPLLLLMRTPGDIFSDADAYLRIYVAAVPFLFLYNTSTAAFNALGDSRHPPLAADALVGDQHLPRPALRHPVRNGGAGRGVGDPHRAGARLPAGVFRAAAPPQADAVRGEAPRL